MQIRNKLSLYFTITSSLLMLLVMTIIYVLFGRFTNNNFYRSLHERTEVAAQLYLEADEISEQALQKIKQKYLISLPDEVIKVYDSTDQLSFVKDTGQKWSRGIIDEVRKKKYLEYRDYDKQVVGIYYHDNQGDFVILASAVDVYGMERMRNLLKILSILFVTQILVQFIAGRWFAQRALLPVQKVNKQVLKISATDLHLRVHTDNENDELGLLATNFNNLLERLEKSFDLQKTFVGNASHELKTPLTNMIGEIEVAISKDRPIEEYQEGLQSVLVEAERLQNIVSNFLMLSNAENNVAMQKTVPVRLDELLIEIREKYIREQTSKIVIELNDLPEDEKWLIIETNKTLLAHAISNIIQNGLKFSGGQPVICKLFFSEKSVSLTILDRGIGMDKETQQKIFEPFYRNLGSDYYPGHGIGLYISKNIIELLGGAIFVDSKLGEGSSFNIVFNR